MFIPDVQQQQNALYRGEVDFLHVSFDTARDTPAAQRAYREKEKLATANWTLLQGKADGDGGIVSGGAENGGGANGQNQKKVPMNSAR